MNEQATENPGEAPTTAPVPPPANPLREARERRGLTVTQVADQLRLARGVIESLEAGQFTAVGPPVFVRGYLRRYAELVGEGPALIEAALRQNSLGDAAADLTSTRLRALAGTADRRRIGRWPWVIAAAVAVVAAGWWWARRASEPRQGAASNDLVQQQVPAPAATDAPVEGAPLVAGEPGTPGASTAGTAAGGASAAPGQPAAPAPAPHAASPPAAATPAVGLPTSTARPVAAPVASGGPRHQLRLTFKEASWTEVYDAGGARLFYEMGGPGDARDVSGTPPLKIVLGNPTAVAAALDGAALKLPAPRFGTTLRAAIDEHGQVTVDH